LGLAVQLFKIFRQNTEKDGRHKLSASREKMKSSREFTEQYRPI